MTLDLPLADKIVRLHETLTQAGAAHAFGGAIALAYYAEPRATIDIDVNVFVAPEGAGPVFSALESLGLRPDLDRAQEEGQVRVMWGSSPLDLFFSYLPLHEAMRQQLRVVPFRGGTIPILSAEHLVVCKAIFDRPKDWLDIEQVAAADPAPDGSEVLRWMREIVGPGDDRSARVEALLRP